MKRFLLTAALTAAALGIGALVLQRWIAATFVVAIVLVVVWFVLIAAVALVLGRSRPGVRTPMLITVAVLALASAGVGYLTAFRKDEVNENVAMAEGRVPEQERAAALAGGSELAPPSTPDARSDSKREAKPVELAFGSLTGADGHAASGSATLIREPDGKRVLTLTDLDADPGPDVNVYLSTSTDGIDDAIDLGSLKGEVGNQQYSIPDDADLSDYDDLVLWCKPFTTRIATAELR